jgi:serine/threonine protein kinase
LTVHIPTLNTTSGEKKARLNMPTLEEGQVFERYFIIRWLGDGVSGESYEAKDIMLQQKVTLKLIHPWTLLPDSARRQFFREMQGIGRLNHSYLASVLDYGENNGKLYVARRYTTSSSLLGNEGRMWFRPPLNIPEAIRYSHQLAKALANIHDHGYLHGGLTFTNILVLRGPNVENDPYHEPFLLADIGLANFVRRFGQVQPPPLPITAAPEQLGKRVTPASDQFALAVLLFSWLAACPPYLGSPEEIEHQKLTESIASLRALNTEVTGEQEAIVRRALAVYPDERHSSILEFTQALVATITPQARPGAQPEPVPESQPETLSSNHTQAETSPAPARFIITLSYGEGSQEVVLEREEITIGRAGSSDILLEHDTQTSRHHALLKREAGQYIIYDRRSISGIFVNGQKLIDDAGHILVNGDHVRIGNYELVFRLGMPSPIN